MIKLRVLFCFTVLALSYFNSGVDGILCISCDKCEAANVLGGIVDCPGVNYCFKQYSSSSSSTNIARGCASSCTEGNTADGLNTIKCCSGNFCNHSTSVFKSSNFTMVVATLLSILISLFVIRQ